MKIRSAEYSTRPKANMCGTLSHPRPPYLFSKWRRRPTRISISTGPSFLASWTSRERGARFLRFPCFSRSGVPTFSIMPRRSSGGRPAPRAAPRAAPVRNPPQPTSHAPPPAPVQSSGGGILSGIGSTIAQGMAFGTGSAVAHRAVDAVLGPRTIQHENVVSEGPSASGAAMNTSGSDACGVHSKAFQDCLNNYGTDISKCQFYLDMLSECRRNSGMMSA